jgi:dGTPase
LAGRKELERDYDRVLFSTPVRRLADKTQLFPLETHDAVRTRLTHSHEVSVLARAVGLDLVERFGTRIGLEPTIENSRRVAALMATVGLVHDLGNPPFGHQGEEAIRSWFEANRAIVFAPGCGVPEHVQQDFLFWEGNAQTFRLVTRLQVQRGDDMGLNLTFATLAALLKYTVPSDQCQKAGSMAGVRKPGFFRSEAEIVEQVWRETCLRPGQRHPLTYLVEACDDIAYRVIDAEDAVKKNLASYADVRSYLRAEGWSGNPKVDPVIQAVIDSADLSRRKLLESEDGKHISPDELDDLTMQRFRVSAISLMVAATLEVFVQNVQTIDAGTFAGTLIEKSSASLLGERLYEFLKLVVFPHRAVLEVELRGTLVIVDLMTRLWRAIVDRPEGNRLRAKRVNPLSAYTYGRISENYRRVFESSKDDLPLRYREAQLLTDMIAGMTDSFAIALLEDLKRFDRESAQNR